MVAVIKSSLVRVYSDQLVSITCWKTSMSDNVLKLHHPSLQIINISDSGFGSNANTVHNVTTHKNTWYLVCNGIFVISWNQPRKQIALLLNIFLYSTLNAVSLSALQCFSRRALKFTLSSFIIIITITNCDCKVWNDYSKSWSIIICYCMAHGNNVV